MDYELFELCKAGDTLSIEKMIQTYQQDVYRLALSILDDPDEAEDGTQEAFIAALRALNSFHGDSSYKTWLFSITINICRTRLQRRAARERLKQVTFGIFHTQGKNNNLPEELLIQNEADANIWRAIQKIDDKHRIPIILRYYHDLPISEIAEMLDIPQGTVHSRLNIARERMRLLLREESK
jgi:RNA polymerase sigma-70 factor (ECF subfamily)